MDMQKQIREPDGIRASRAAVTWLSDKSEATRQTREVAAPSMIASNASKCTIGRDAAMINGRAAQS